MRRTLCLIFFSLLFIYTAPSSTFADPQFQTSLSRKQMNAGESVIFSVEVKWPKDESKYQFAFPPFNLLENLTVVRQGQSQENFAGEGGEWIRKTFNFELQGRKKGPARIPGFELSYIDPLSQRAGTFNISEHTLQIREKTNLKWFFILTGLALFSLGLIARLRKLFGRWNQAVPEEEIPSGETHMDRFKSFLENNLHLTHTFTSGLTSHLKQFLADAYGMPDAGHTIDVTQTIRELENKGFSGDEMYEIKTILKIWEEINYAGRVSDAEFREFRGLLLRLIQNKRAALSLS